MVSISREPSRAQRPYSATELVVSSVDLAQALPACEHEAYWPKVNALRRFALFPVAHLGATDRPISGGAYFRGAIFGFSFDAYCVRPVLGHFVGADLFVIFVAKLKRKKKACGNALLTNVKYMFKMCVLFFLGPIAPNLG